MFLVANIYFATYVLAYIAWVEPRWDYFGLGLRDDLDWADVTLIWLLAVTPSLFLRDRFRYPSDFLRAIQYLIIYVPTLWVTLNASRPILERGDAWAMDFVLCAAITGQLAIGTRLPIRPLPVKRLGPTPYLFLLAGLTLLMMAYMFAQIGSEFRLVSLLEIYELRMQASESLQAAGSLLGGYFFNWLSSVLLPLVLAIGLLCHRSGPVAIALVGYVLLYGLWGSKAALFAPFILVGIYVLVRDPRSLHMRQITSLCCVLLALPLLFLLLDTDLKDFLTSWYISLAHQRTFSSSALAIPQYFDFFQHHPLTYGSHITGLSALIPYPFDLDVPRTVGLYYYGAPMTANVNYWAQDGIAALGLIGIPCIAFLATLVYWLLDCAAARVDTRFAIVSVVYIAMQLADTSLFTSFVTGGLGLMIIFLAVFPRRLLGFDTRQFVRR